MRSSFAVDDGQDTATLLDDMLTALSFVHVREVRKARRIGLLNWRGMPVEIVLDDVQGLGNFVELEVTTDESQLDMARQVVQTLADDLGLGTHERRSYLEMLIEAEGGA